MKRKPKEGSLVKLHFQSPLIKTLVTESLGYPIRPTGSYRAESVEYDGIVKFGLMVNKNKCVIFDTGAWDLTEFYFNGDTFESFPRGKFAWDIHGWEVVS